MTAMPTELPATAGALQAAPRRPSHRRGLTTRRGDAFALVAGIGGGLAAGTSLAVGRTQLGSPGGPATVLGATTAMLGTYLCLVLLLLISRVPWLEREVGHDRMVLWHRRWAPWSLLLIGGHVVLTTIGWGQSSDQNVVREAWSLITGYAWMVPATAAFALMVALGVMSYRRVRSRMKYETWWAAHLYFYLAVVLAFGHQIEIGSTFVDRPLLEGCWIALYLLVAAAIIGSRVVVPLARSFRHQLRVVAVVPEGHGVVSVYMRGRGLASLHARGGQFFQWRFLTRHWWWQAHPYSMSAAPRGDMMRVTVKDLGDQSGALLSDLRPGTRVAIEGPYGVFTATARHADLVTAFAAGVGITPIRALLDDLPVTTRVTLLYRVRDMNDVPLRRELEALAFASGWTLWYLPGPREAHPMTVSYLTRFAPDLPDSDVYVCGPDPFTNEVLEAARSAGIPEHHLHHESFAF